MNVKLIGERISLVAFVYLFIAEGKAKKYLGMLCSTLSGLLPESVIDEFGNNILKILNNQYLKQSLLA